MMDNGIFGDLFDFNHDGELDSFEKAMEFEMLDNMMKDDVSDDCDDGAEDIEMVGLDYDEISCMDEDERREVLEDAGLDPDDYEF